MSRLREEKNVGMSTRMKLRTVAKRGGVLLAAALILTSCGWKGIANVPVPGGAGTGRTA